MTFPERLTLLRGKTSRALFAKQLGINENTLRNYEKGLSLPNIDVAARICQIYGVTPGWLLTGDGPMRTGETAASTNDAGLVMIPKVVARLSAGGGSLETNAEVKGRYAFKSEWLRGKGRVDRMVLMEVSGDSMEPYICDGDTVLIDQSQDKVLAGKVYAVGVEEAVYVKFVELAPGRMILRSANPAHVAMEANLAEDSNPVRIIGRVIWWCREAR